MRRLVRELNALPEYVDLANQQAHLRSLPAGDGHPVVVVPGLLASNASTVLLRRFLGSKGYATAGWTLGRNRGSIAQFDAFIDEVQDRATTTGEPVSLIGWSLGGIASRWAAHNRPDAVRQIITLGSPFRRDPRGMSIFPLYQAVGRVRREDFTDERLDAVAATPAMPTTSIVSVDDAIAPPESGYQPATSTSETVEVSGSHSGLVRNPDVWRIVSDRLAQPVDQWRPYGPTPVRPAEPLVPEGRSLA